MCRLCMQYRFLFVYSFRFHNRRCMSLSTWAFKVQWIFLLEHFDVGRAETLNRPNSAHLTHRVCESTKQTKTTTTTKAHNYKRRHQYEWKHTQNKNKYEKSLVSVIVSVSRTRTFNWTEYLSFAYTAVEIRKRKKEKVNKNLVF